MASLPDHVTPSSLSIRPIIYGQSPAGFFDLMKANETVHPVASVADFRERAGTGDRITLGLFRNGEPEKPLAYIAVALTKGIVGSMRDILGPERQVAAHPDTAIFYSINRTDGGVEKQIKPGAALIEHLFPYMAQNYPHITQQSTLSPVPGLVKWLGLRLPDGPEPKDQREETAFKAVGSEIGRQWRELKEAVLNPTQTARDALNGAGQLLQALTAIHVVFGQDPVAKFHGGNNGAQVERVNLFADPQPLRAQESLGVQVNHRYASAEEVRRANRDFASTNGFRACSDEVAGLLGLKAPLNPLRYTVSANGLAL